MTEGDAFRKGESGCLVTLSPPRFTSFPLLTLCSVLRVQVFFKLSFHMTFVPGVQYTGDFLLLFFSLPCLSFLPHMKAWYVCQAFAFCIENPPAVPGVPEKL